MEDYFLDQIDDAYWDAEEFGDWINFHAQSQLSSKLDDVLDAAYKSVKKGNFEPAIDAGFEIIRRNVEVINHTDDSYGYLGGIMHDALRLLRNIAGQDLDDDSRELFIDSCEKSLKDKIFDGWDWFIDVYEFLVMLAQTPEECRQLIRRIKKDERLSKDYYVESQMKFIHKLIEKSEGEEAALQFMMKNLQVEDFRKQAIDRAINAKDFAQAYQLGENGIAQEKEHRYGLISTWNDCLLKTAQAEGNRDRIITYARRLYLDSYNIEGDFYAILKANVPQEQWQDFALQLAEDAQHSRRKERYAEICARENWHQRLMDYVNRGLDIRTLHEYEDMLLVSHRQEVIDFYIRYIWHVMEGYRCRATYKEVCRYLRHIYRLGAGQQVVVDIANDLRTKYRRCPALLEELDRLPFIHS